MRIATAVLGAVSALLVIVVGMQAMQLQTANAELTDTRQELNQCRIDLAKAEGRSQAAAPPMNANMGMRPPQQQMRSPDAPAGGAGGQMGAMGTADGQGQMPPRPPMNQQVPQTLEEARDVVDERLGQWADASGISQNELDRISGVFQGLLDDLEATKTQLEAGELEPQDAMRMLAEGRKESLDELRAEMGDDAFRDMWMNSGAAPLVSPPPPRRPPPGMPPQGMPPQGMPPQE